MSNSSLEDRTPGLRKSDIDPNPFKQFASWYEEAIGADLILPNAMALATATKGGVPSVRMVLLKDFDERGFVFYTNYNSPKARDLDENPNAALVFYWAQLNHQIRIAGQVARVSREESAAYFQTRPIDSKLGAWASNQSSVIDNRALLEYRIKDLADYYEGGDVPLPPFWGGYRLAPDSIEFWLSRQSRLHDRLRYRREGDEWIIERLAP
jgi:pyridoxamine 5'-phosphate oxidase